MTTEGSFASTASMKLSELSENAGVNATNNMLASKEFVSAFMADTPAAAPTGQPALDPILLLNAAPLKGGVPQNIDTLKNAVVTVETGSGWGSGFFTSIATAISSRTAMSCKMKNSCAYAW